MGSFRRNACFSGPHGPWKVLAKADALTQSEIQNVSLFILATIPPPQHVVHPIYRLTISSPPPYLLVFDDEPGAGCFSSNLRSNSNVMGLRGSCLRDDRD